MNPRTRQVAIKEWVREINGRRYKFNVTYWPPSCEAVYSVWRRGDKFGWVQIHMWRVKADGFVEGTYR